MRAVNLTLCLLALLASTAGAQRRESPAAADSRFAIQAVTIIDPTAGSLAEVRIPNRTVIVDGDRIARIGPTSSTPVPDGVRTIDGRGMFLLPGFWDMHVHFNRDTATQLRVMAPLMIAHGITSVRDMLGDCWEPCGAGRRTLAEMRALQRRIEDGEVLAPRLQALSSPVVHGQRGAFGYPINYPDYWQPRTEAQGREVARYLKARGVDFVKAYQSLVPEAYFGLLDEARRAGLDVAGHLPWAVRPTEAARRGVRTIEHARWPALACNSAYPSFRAMYESFARGESDFDTQVFKEFRDAVVSRFDAGLCAEIFEALVENDVYLVPTHLTREMDAMASDSAYRNDPRRVFVPPARLRGWDRDLTNTAKGPQDLLRFYREFFELGLKVTGMADAAGVKIMVGTDAFDTMVFPGFSYHDELEHLAAAGLSPIHIIEAATVRPAEFLGLADAAARASRSGGFCRSERTRSKGEAGATMRTAAACAHGPLPPCHTVERRRNYPIATAPPPLSVTFWPTGTPSMQQLAGGISTRCPARVEKVPCGISIVSGPTTRAATTTWLVLVSISFGPSDGRSASGFGTNFSKPFDRALRTARWRDEYLALFAPALGCHIGRVAP